MSINLPFAYQESLNISTFRHWLISNQSNVENNRNNVLRSSIEM